MASRNTSANTGRKQMTYGSAARQRTSTRPNAVPLLHSSLSPQTANVGTGTITSARPTDMPRNSSTIHERNSASKGPPKSEARGRSEDRAQKRKHSSAFAEAPGMGIQSKDDPSLQLQPAVGLSRTETIDTNNTAPLSSIIGTETTRHEAGLLPPIALHSSGVAEAPPGRNDNRLRPLDAESQRSRRRLIDTLTAQKVDSGSESETLSSPGSASEDDNAARPVAGSSYASPSRRFRQAQTRTPDRRPLLSKSRKVKLTYSQSRSFLGGGSQSTSDTSLYDNTAEGVSPAETVLVPPKMSPPPADYDFEEEPSNMRLGIRSVHELRRAGANNRFSDEMDDLLSRIGKPTAAPSSMRRNALCELARKLERRGFAGQFRDHAARDKIVRNIGGETDIISGFSLAASLVIFLSSSPAPHLLRQMAADRVGKLLARLLKSQDDVEELVTLKTLNLARNTKTALVEVEAQLLRMAIWQEQAPSALTPRTLALQLFYIISRDADPGCLEEVSADMHDDIASVALTYAADESRVDVDYALIILALEAQSNLMSLGGNQYTPAIASFLHRTLRRWPSQRCSLDTVTLKLSINICNTESGAAAFDETSLLSNLITSISNGLSLVHATVDNDGFENDMYEELLLILGIMINILEHCAHARASVDSSSLDKLVRLWVDSSSVFSGADSLGQSKLGVAFGYVAITIGYIYLAPSCRLQMREHKDWPGTNHLIDSIKEFLGICKTIDNKLQELDVLVSDLQKLQLGGG